MQWQINILPMSKSQIPECVAFTMCWTLIHLECVNHMYTEHIKFLLNLIEWILIHEDSRQLSGLLFCTTTKTCWCHFKYTCCTASICFTNLVFRKCNNRFVKKKTYATWTHTCKKQDLPNTHSTYKNRLDWHIISKYKNCLICSSKKQGLWNICRPYKTHTGTLNDTNGLLYTEYTTCICPTCTYMQNQRSMVVAWY